MRRPPVVGRLCQFRWLYGPGVDVAHRGKWFEHAGRCEARQIGVVNLQDVGQGPGAGLLQELSFIPLKRRGGALDHNVRVEFFVVRKTWMGQAPAVSK